MFKIYSVSFYVGSYDYSIAYHQQNDDLQLDTNDEAAGSMAAAIAALRGAIREYAAVDLEFNVELNSVFFGDDKKDHRVRFTAVSADKAVYPIKIIKQSMVIQKLSSREKDVEKIRGKILQLIEDLQNEVEKYLRGERAQRSLDFGDETEEEDPVSTETQVDTFEPLYLFDDD